MAGIATVVPEIGFLSYLVIRLHKLSLQLNMAIIFSQWYHSKGEIVPCSGFK